MIETDSGASTSAAARSAEFGVDVDFVLAEKGPLPRESLSALATVVKVGVPELPVLGPIGLVAALFAYAPVVLADAIARVPVPVGITPFVLLVPIVAGLAVAAFASTLAFTRLDARANGLRARLDGASMVRALRSTPSSFVALSLLAMAGATLTMFAMAGRAVYLAIALLPAFIAVLPRTAPALAYIAVDKVGPFAAIASAWRNTKPQEWGHLWRSLVALFVSGAALIIVVGAYVGFAYCATELTADHDAGIALANGEGVLAFIAIFGVIAPLDVAFVYALYARSRS